MPRISVTLAWSRTIPISLTRGIIHGRIKPLNLRDANSRDSYNQFPTILCSRSVLACARVLIAASRQVKGVCLCSSRQRRILLTRTPCSFVIFPCMPRAVCSRYTARNSFSITRIARETSVYSVLCFHLSSLPFPSFSPRLLSRSTAPLFLYFLSPFC